MIFPMIFFFWSCSSSRFVCLNAAGFVKRFKFFLENENNSGNASVVESCLEYILNAASKVPNDIETRCQFLWESFIH